MRKLPFLFICIFISLPAMAQVRAIEINSDHPASRAFTHLPLTTSDCMGAAGLGGQGQLFGFSISSATQSRPCNIRENAKLAASFNDMELAFAILCQDDVVNIAGKSIGKCANKSAPNNVCDYPTEECKLNNKLK